MHTLKPDFIATARACRRHTERLVAALYDDKPTRLIKIRRNRLYRAYQAQVKQPA